MPEAGGNGPDMQGEDRIETDGDAAPFGVPQLDRIWSAVPHGARILFANDPGVQGGPFLYAAARHHLEAGADVVFAVTDQPPSSVVRALLRAGVDLAKHEDRLHLVDAYSPLLGLRDEGAWNVPDPLDLDAWGTTLGEIAHRHPDAVLLIDSFSTIVDHIGLDRFQDQYEQMRPVFARFRQSAALFTRWPYAEDVRRLYDQFDAVVSLQSVQERIVMSQYFSVERSGWVQDLDRRPRLYKALECEGVIVYIPKIIVTGPFNAGKSTFVRSVCESTVSVDRMGTTVALDHGAATIDGLRAEVFGTPGQSRFDPILKIIAGQALGVVVVVDATRPDSFARAKAMMDQVWRQGLPVIIAANKQDRLEALSPDEVAAHLHVPPYVRVVGCVGEDPASAKAVLATLLDTIMTPPTADPSFSAAVIGGGAT